MTRGEIESGGKRSGAQGLGPSALDPVHRWRQSQPGGALCLQRVGGSRDAMRRRGRHISHTLGTGMDISSQHKVAEVQVWHGSYTEGMEVRKVWAKRGYLGTKV